MPNDLEQFAADEMAWEIGDTATNCDSPGHSERGSGSVNSYRWRVHPQENWRHWNLCEGCAADFSKSVEIETKGGTPIEAEGCPLCGMGAEDGAGGGHVNGCPNSKQQGLECQCESIHCGHGDEPCPNMNAAPAKTVAFGTFNFCPSCRKGYEEAGYLSEEQ